MLNYSQAIHIDADITKKKLFQKNSNLSWYLTQCNMPLKNFNQEKLPLQRTQVGLVAAYG